MLASLRPRKIALPSGLAGRFLSDKPFQVVNSHNEFDPLEEVIVGSVEGAVVPEWHVSGKAVWPTSKWDFFKTQSGRPFPQEIASNGQSFASCMDASCMVASCIMQHANIGPMSCSPA
jgi:hypothetical protein